MIGLGILIFGTVLALMLVSIWLGWKVVSAQRRQKVTAMVGSAAAAAVGVAAQETLVLQDQKESALTQFLQRLDAVGRMERILDQSGLTWNLSGLGLRMGIGFVVGLIAGFKLRVLIVA